MCVPATNEQQKKVGRSAWRDDGIGLAGLDLVGWLVSGKVERAPTD